MSQSVDKEILDVLPKIKEAKNIVGLMDRDTLTFDVALQRTEDEVRQFWGVSSYVGLCQVARWGFVQIFACPLLAYEDRKHARTAKGSGNVHERGEKSTGGACMINERNPPLLSLSRHTREPPQMTAYQVFGWL